MIHNFRMNNLNLIENLKEFMNNKKKNKVKKGKKTYKLNFLNNISNNRSFLIFNNINIIFFFK